MSRFLTSKASVSRPSVTDEMTEGSGPAADAPDQIPDATDPGLVTKALMAAGKAAYRWSIRDDTITWSANVAEVLAGVDSELIGTGRGFASLLDPGNLASRYETVLMSGKRDYGSGVPFQIEYRFRPRGRASPEVIWIEDTGRWFAGPKGRPAEVYGTLHNVDDRREREEQLRYLSAYDPLTGLMNRNRLTDMLDEAINFSERSGKPCALMLIAIDNLEIINEAYGFDVADHVIDAVSKRLRGIMRAGDVIGRYAGNKFALVLGNCSEEDMEHAAARFLAIVRDKVIETGRGPVWTTVSIGGVGLPKFAETVKDAIAHAEEALAEARRRPTDSFLVYQPSRERSHLRERNLRCGAEIISSLKEDRLVQAYQPIVSAQSGMPAFFETLLRLERGIEAAIPAGDIVPAAEQLGLIRLVDLRVVELVLNVLERFPDARLSVNVSGVTATDPRWFERITDSIAQRRSVADRLIVEITETAALFDVQHVRRSTEKLQALGCGIAIDDFGAGFTSFKNLRELKVDMVKLHGSFCNGISAVPDNRVFVRSLIDLAKHFGVEVVAEWVEQPGDAELLKELGVDYLQGNLYGAASLALPWQTNALNSLGERDSLPVSMNTDTEVDASAAEHMHDRAGEAEHADTGRRRSLLKELDLLKSVLSDLEQQQLGRRTPADDAAKTVDKNGFAPAYAPEIPDGARGLLGSMRSERYRDGE